MGLRDRFGAAIMLITHDLGVIAKACDRVLVMYGGQIMESAPVDDVFHAPRHPYTRGLLKSIPRIEMARDEALNPIEGTPPDLFAPPVGCPFARAAMTRWSSAPSSPAGIRHEHRPSLPLLVGA